MRSREREPADRRRWPNVEEIYHAALDRSGLEREAFVRDACEGDERLRTEIESLLDYDRAAATLMTAPVLETIDPDWFQSARLVPGQRLGPYEIRSLLGSGGMGDVYRAHDTKLNRDVAIKILPDVFTADVDRRRLFEREARLLAALNHPHIGAIYGFEERDGVQALILELVEGSTLAEALRAGRLPIIDALAIARQIADALEAAHEKGIVHRDLKPANITISRQGVVKVLDFGVATASGLEELPGGGLEGGVILGTAAYMSPEQARGSAVDRRTDIWAFGCVLWEMVSGLAAFRRVTHRDTIAAIFGAGPEWRLVPADTPPEIVRLLQRCLERDPDRRLGAIAEARTSIETVLEAVLSTRDGLDRKIRKPAVSKTAAATLVMAAVVGAGVLAVRSAAPVARGTTYAQITNFTDYASAPALSRDGRLLAFIRGDRPFLATDDIYLKDLSGGEATLLSSDRRAKCCLAFSPDGSMLAYTAATRDGWHTFTVPTRGGDSTLLRKNAAALTWLDPHRVLFSSIKTGVHMGIESADGDERPRDVYFPPHERSMAHYSFASPDRRWALVVEMDPRPVWDRCRLIALDGHTPARPVGPEGECSSAGWSPDGRWMYFSAAVDHTSHLWRQRFPDGEPEQITFGPTQEDGLAVAPDGSLLTSVGLEQNSLWIHDAAGEHPLLSEGQVMGRMGSYSMPVFSADGTSITYIRRAGTDSPTELWRTDTTTGRSEPMLPGTSLEEYDISPDGNAIVFKTLSAGRRSELWIAPTDRSAPPKRIAALGESSPYFGPAGEVLFRFAEANANYFGRMNRDGSGRSKVVEYPIATVQNISPDRRWLVAIAPHLNAPTGAATMAIPTGGGPPERICAAACHCAWSPDGKVLYVEVQFPSRNGPGKYVALPVLSRTGLPDVPEGGIGSEEQALSIPGSWVVPQGKLVPGPSPGVYAYLKTSAQRNLFRIKRP